MMKARNITRNLHRKANRTHGEFVKGQRFHRGFLQNDQVRYLTHSGALMFCSDGEYQLVHFKPGTTSHHSLV